MTKSYATIEQNLSTLMLKGNPDINGNECTLNIDFMRTLRIPDDNKKYNLPPGLGKFPLKHVEDYEKVPQQWKNRGGIFLPIHQSEALWIKFNGAWPFAVKIATGKINAVSGEEWNPNLSFKVKLNQSFDRIPPNNMNIGDYLKTNNMQTGSFSPFSLADMKRIEHDYIVTPKQPWLDGFNVGKGVIRQFVAMPLGEGYTAEEQLTGKAEHGGIQIIAYPMKKEHYEKIKQEKERSFSLVASGALSASSGVLRSRSIASASVNNVDMGLGAGGFMTQDIYEDPYDSNVWDLENPVRVFVHLANALEYHNITGEQPSNKPLEPKDYKRYNYPWFDYYAEGAVLEPSKKLASLDSIESIKIKKGEEPLDSNHNFEQPKPNIIGVKPITNKNW